MTRDALDYTAEGYPWLVVYYDNRKQEYTEAVTRAFFVGAAYWEAVKHTSASSPQVVAIYRLDKASDIMTGVG